MAYGQNCISRGVTGIIFWGGKVIFPDFFSGVKCFFFPVENSHFGRPKTNFRRFQKWKKKKGALVLTLFYNFSSFHSFHFQFSTFPFSLLQVSFFPSQFSPLFPFPLASLFPIRRQKFPRQKSLGGTLPPCPPPVTPLASSCDPLTLCLIPWITLNLLSTVHG